MDYLESLPAADRAAIDRLVAAHATRGGRPSGREAVVGLAELVSDSDRGLAAIHARLLAEGKPARVASVWLAEWFAGGAASVVGAVWAQAGVGVLLQQELLQWQVAPEGWPRSVTCPGAGLGLPDGHPLSATSTARDLSGDLRRVEAGTVARLVAALDPIVLACAELGRVRPSFLWAEVGDGLGMALLGRTGVTPEMLARLRLLLEAPGAPWGAGPEIDLVETESLGAVPVARRAGCCLVFRLPALESPTGWSADPMTRRFPTPGHGRRYCVTCRHLSWDEAVERQVYAGELAFRR